MSAKLWILAALAAVAAGSACGGDPFGGSDDPKESAAGASNGSGASAGTGGGEDGDPSEGGGAGREVGGGGAGAGGRPSPSEGGNPPGDAGAPASGAAGEGGEPNTPIFTTLKPIDDMEDGNATLLGSNGDWFVFKDDTGGVITPAKEETFTMSALVPARGASTKAALVTATGFTDWGAALGFDFAYSAKVRQQTDLGAAQGVRFWVKASEATTLRFQLPNADTDPLGGKCSGAGENACNAHWTKTVAVTTEWKQATVAFADLKQDLPGRHVPTFDKRHVYSGFFIIGPNQSLSVWVDDIELVK